MKNTTKTDHLRDLASLRCIINGAQDITLKIMEGAPKETKTELRIIAKSLGNCAKAISEIEGYADEEK